MSALSLPLAEAEEPVVVESEPTERSASMAIAYGVGENHNVIRNVKECWDAFV